MGITKSPDGFKPFYIKIDTKTEAEFLWHLLNNDLKICFSEYLKQEKLNQNRQKYEELKTQFFQKLEEQIKKQTLVKEAKE